MRRSVGVGLAVALAARVAEGRPLALRVVDGSGVELRGDEARASIERTPPAWAPKDVAAPDGDPDAVRFVVVGAKGELPLSVVIRSASKGREVDRLAAVALSGVACPAGVEEGAVCASTTPIRAVTDDVDRSHPVVKDRSIKVELGGELSVATPGGEALRVVPVGPPRVAGAGAGPLTAAVRLFLVRLTPGGAPPIGADASDAARRAREELAGAAAAWGQCGVDLGDAAKVEVKIVDPPPPHLLAVGCDAAIPASGGFFVFNADGKRFEVKIPAGTSPRGAARLAARSLEKGGFVATIFDGGPGLASPYGPSDVSVRRKNGELAILATARDPGPDGVAPKAGHASTDATLDACIGSVWLDEGLDHFTDSTAGQGSLEERTLVHAFDDGDPRTVDVFVVPGFSAPSRIGESFIFTDRGSIKNVILEDRAGVRAGHASLTLAHELGHVLLGDPGHPDDFGVDTPTRLMDSDAVDGSAFGPRRLTLPECARALRESGPSSAVPILLAPSSAAPLVRAPSPPRSR